MEKESQRESRNKRCGGVPRNTQKESEPRREREITVSEIYVEISSVLKERAIRSTVQAELLGRGEGREEERGGEPR